MTDINRQKTADLKQAVYILTGRDDLSRGQRMARITQVELTHNARAFAYLDKAGRIEFIEYVRWCFSRSNTRIPGSKRGECAYSIKYLIDLRKEPEMRC